MKKYKISAYYSMVYIGSLILTLPVLLIGIYGVVNDLTTVSWLFLIIGVVGVVLFIYQMIFDFPLGSFCVDETKIIICVGLKKYEHKWSDFVECGYSKSYAGNGYLYWIYLSTYELTDKEVFQFLKKTRRDLNHIAFFKYNHKNFNEIVSCMPPDLATKMYEIQIDITNKMSWLEKKYH